MIFLPELAGGTRGRTRCYPRVSTTSTIKKLRLIGRAFLFSETFVAVHTGDLRLFFRRKDLVHACTALGTFAFHGAAAFFTESNFLSAFSKITFCLTFYAVTVHRLRGLKITTFPPIIPYFELKSYLLVLKDGLFAYFKLI